MRFWPMAPIFAAMAACFPAAPVKRPLQVAAAVPVAPAALVVKPPETPPLKPELTTVEISGITFEGVSFDTKIHRLTVVDQASGPGTEFADAAAVARAHGALAAANAGFFTPEGEPLGLVVSHGKSTGAWNAASSLGSGAWREDTAGNVTISRRENLGRATARQSRQLIQAGPMLRENGRSIGGLERQKISVRMLVLSDGGSRWWIGRSTPCSLAALGDALSTGNPAGWPVRDALNLDGGRSADLWVSSAISGGPLVRRSPWNRPVRNFLILIPR